MLPFSFEITKQKLNTRHLNINTVDLFPLAMYLHTGKYFLLFCVKLRSGHNNGAHAATAPAKTLEPPRDSSGLSGLGLEAPPDSKDSSPLGSCTTLGITRATSVFIPARVLPLSFFSVLFLSDSNLLPHYPCLINGHHC